MEALADIDVARQEFYVGNRLLHTPRFQMADGRARFVPHKDQLRPASARPFTLLSIRSEGQFNSIIYDEEDSYRGISDRWSVLMNMTDLLELGLSEGDLVDLQSDSGIMKRLRVKCFDLPPRCVAAYYPEANCLTTRALDPRSHTPQFKSVPVSVSTAR